MTFACEDTVRGRYLHVVGGPHVQNYVTISEIAVEAFLERRIGFTRIADLVEATLDELGASPAPATIEAAIELDSRARARARRLVDRRA